jgi:hypothetical protein
MKTQQLLRIVIGSILFAVFPVQASVIFFESGHHTWTDADPYYDEVFLKNDASLDFLGGTIGQLSTFHDSLVNFEGGQMDSLWTFDNSIVRYHAGQLDYISAGHNSIVFLYAYDVTYDPTGGINNQGYVEGFFYKNDEAFNISCWNSPTWSHIEIVPEPNTLLILGLGGLVLRKRKCQKKSHF